MRAGFGSHKTFSTTFSKNRGQREKMLERDSERENQRRGGVPLLLVGFIILPLFLGLPLQKVGLILGTCKGTTYGKGGH